MYKTRSMKKLLTFLMVTLVFFVSLMSQSSVAAAPTHERVLIGFHGPVNTALVEQAGGDVDHVFKHIPVVEARLPSAAIFALSQAANIAYIESNEVVKATDIIPWGIERIFGSEQRLSDTWMSSEGEGVGVAVLDTGIDGSHADLNVVGGINLINNDPYDVDQNTHGTHVAGIIAALNQQSGIAGVAPGVSLYSVTVLDAAGSGYMSDVIQGIEWAMNQNIEIINMSLGAESSSNALESITQAAFDAGHLLIAAAGNEGVQSGQGDTVSYPAKLPSVIAVAAASESDQRASFSSHGEAVELIAPGVNILSTMPGDDYAYKNGTSMAAPHVAGVAALMWSINPSLTNIDIRQILQESAEDLGLSANHQGYGMVDGFKAFNTAHAALEAVEYTVNVSPLEHGVISPSGTFNVPAGSTVSFEIVPDEGYQIDQIQINDEPVLIEDVVMIENIQENIDLAVMLSPKMYTLNYETFGGSDMDTAYYLYGTDLSEPEDPSKTGHSFTGWFLDEETEDPFVFDTMPANDLTLYAGWQIQDYDLKFYDAFDQLFDTISLTYGTDLSEIDLPDPPTKEGHTFIGFHDTLPSVMPAEDLVFYAEYEVNTYTISLLSEDGQLLDALSFEFGQTLNLPDPPQKTGMMFDGWKDAFGDTFMADTMPAKNLTLSATYTEQTYQLYFLDEDGNPYETLSFIFQASLADVVLPEGPKKEGHTFINWDRSLPDQMPEYDVVFKPEYRVNTYEIYYQTAEEMANHVVYLEYGKPIPHFEPPTRSGYQFKGWHDMDGPVDIDTMPAYDLVFMATYEALPINLEGVFDGQVYQHDDAIYIAFTGQATLNDEPVEPGEITVEPGDYVLEITSGDATETVNFTVQSHPYQSLDVLVLALMVPLFSVIGMAYLVKFVLWTVGMI